MKKRRAYIGLSTPLFYDYSVNMKKCINDIYSSPNPILDSPFGLFLMYDEIWFLCESLCPNNLRNASFVKFLDKELSNFNLNEIVVEAENILRADKQELLYNYSPERQAFEKYQDTLIEQGVSWKAAADNHSHCLTIFDSKVSANSIDKRNILIDIGVINSLKKLELEFITNSFTNLWFVNSYEQLIHDQLAQALIINNIPNYISQSGPYVPCIEEARESKYLKYYRKWIIERSQNIISPSEIKDIKDEVENEIQTLQNEMFLKNFSKKKYFMSTSNMIIGTAVDTAMNIPLSTALGCVGNMANLLRNHNAWQAFIVESRQWG